jgi:hypothetical protein
MAALSQAERDRITRWFMRAASRADEPLSVTKIQLAAAVAAADDWADANAAAFNSALPTAFRNSATANQKALLLAYVILRRYGSTPSQEGD